MIKSVENYQLLNLILKDSLRSNYSSKKVEYYSAVHKMLKKEYLIKKAEKFNGMEINNFQENYHCAELAHSSIENEGTFKLYQVNILRDINSEKVFKCLKTFNTKTHLYVVYESHPQMTLSKYEKEHTLKIEQKEKLVSELILLLKEIHHENVIIGNLSPENIFVNNHFKVFASNLFLAKKTYHQSLKINNFLLDQNNFYYAPELLQKGILSKAADIYSLGMIFNFLNVESENQSPNFLVMKDWIITRMTSNAIEDRPSLDEIEKLIFSNHSVFNSTIDTNDSIEREEREVELKKLKNYKSQENLTSLEKRNGSNKIITVNFNKESMIEKGIKSSERNEIRQKRFGLKHKNTFDTIQSEKVLELEEFKSKRETFKKNIQEKDFTSIQSSNNSEITRFNHFYKKQKELVIMRNLVSFLLEMTAFVHSENNLHDLSYLLVQEAEIYCQTSLEILKGIIDEGCYDKNILSLNLSSKEEAKKISAIKDHFKVSFQHDFFKELDFNQELKSFARSMLNLYSTKVSQETTNMRNHDKKETKTKDLPENEMKLFKTLLLLKRIEYGSYYEFFKAKIHHMDRKYWDEHYFEFEKTFGGKYFAIQIKDIVSRRSVSTERHRLYEKNKKWL